MNPPWGLRPACRTTGGPEPAGIADRTIDGIRNDPGKQAMSIVSYHARVGESVLTALQANSDLFFELPQKAGPAEDELFYIDKDWWALSWLLSAKAREAQKHDVVRHAIMWNERDGEKLDEAAWRAAEAREAARLGIELVDTSLMPDDPALIAVQGSGPTDERLAQISYYVFDPTKVASLSAALDHLTEADMRAHFDPKLMQEHDVAGIRWTEEEPDVLDTILIPIFNALKAFYAHAARAGQYVLVVHW
jgi:hypothetical protein